MNYEGAIPVCVGAYAALLAFGVVPISGNPERAKQWFDRYGTLMKVCAPMCMLFGIGQTFKWFG